MNIEQEREKLILFTKIGAIVLTSFALLATSFFVYPENRAVFNESLLHEKELPIYCVEKKKPQISISFDAAWGNDDTASLLATLKKHKVKATFFMTGGWIEKYPDDVKAIAAKDNITAIYIHSTRMLNAYGFLRRVFSIFEH